MKQKIKSDELIHLGRNIKELRMKMNMTQEEVTQKLQLRGFSITRSTYAKMEIGMRHISASQLEAIRDILKTTYEELMEHTGEERIEE